MTLEPLFHRLLHEASPDDLWALQPHLLAQHSPEADSARALARQFYCYLSQLRSKLSSKQYSTLSAWLAGGSLGVLAVQDIIESFHNERRDAIANLLAGGLAGALEVVANMQHVQAWEVEFGSVLDDALWELYGALWRLSEETQPDLPPEHRQALVETLLNPLRSPSSLPNIARAAVQVRLFQVLLAIRLVPVLSAVEQPS
jgi:hypothetical protein